MRTALCQINTVVGDLPGNLSKIQKCIKNARSQSCEVAVFPELAISGYPPEDLLMRRGFLRNCEESLREAAAAAVGGITVFLGCPVFNNGKVYNICAVLRGGKIVHEYKKIALPNYSVFDEKRYFEPGSVYGIVPVNGGIVGISVCEDIWDRNHQVESLLKEKISFLVNISASPFHAGKISQRKKVLRNTALKCSAPVLYCNLVGGQDELVFDGGSMVFSGEGKLQAEAARFQEDMLITDIKKSGGIKPVKISRSKNNMGPTAEVYNALVLGIRDYIEKNGFRSAVIGLSGGIDSAVAAALAAASLGSKNVKCISMPTVYSSEGTKSDAEKLASNLGVWFREVPVQEVYDIFKKLMKPDFSGMPEDTAEENLQARIRGTVLMTYSNKFGDIVLTTGNKSETSVGYCTLYGDMAGGFAPLKDVPKTLVYRLASYINRINKRNIIPSGIIKRPPSAELSENQKDSDSLPPYDVLDRIIDCFIEKEMDGRAIVDTGIPEKTVREVLSLIYQNEYKRRQAPPGIKITPIAFGKDRRMPITNRYRF